MKRYLTAALIIGLVLPAAATAATWQIDPGHSSAEFKVRHLAVANVTGRFGKVSGTVAYDAADPSKSSVEATIDTSTINTANEDRDKHLKSDDFFAVEKHPAITFKSTKVESSESGGLKVTGDLTIRGVTKQVVLDVEGPFEPIKDPWGNTKTGATATTTINRQDFGLTWNKTLEAGGLLVGNDVRITIEVELKQV